MGCDWLVILVVCCLCFDCFDLFYWWFVICYLVAGWLLDCICVI